MPQWTREPPAEPRGPALPIRRTPAYKPMIAIVTSEDLIGCYTHFYKGHTVPCERGARTPNNGDQNPECDACHDGIPYRWHAYLSAVDQADAVHIIFECTAQASEAFTTYRTAFGTLRGCIFEARRLNQRPNGRVIIRTKPADLAARRIPTAPDICKCMAIIWSKEDQDVTTNRLDPERQTPIASLIPKLRDPNQLPADQTKGTKT